MALSFNSAVGSPVAERPPNTKMSLPCTFGVKDIAIFHLQHIIQRAV